MRCFKGARIPIWFGRHQFIIPQGHFWEADSSGHTSELHALGLRHRVFKPEGVLFKLASLTKVGAAQSMHSRVP